ncbi:MAG: histidinol-phosphatase [Agathobacter sp.]|nr:histidinol-phosphatase [Agathobacter sp.]
MDYLKANYHTHTWRCRHASGSEREYIEAAIRMGIEELGFSDHVPCPFRNGYVSGIRMKMEQAAEYVDTIRRLGAEYRDQIRLYVGFEAEYCREFHEDQMYMFRMLDCDYLILGQHYLGSEETGPYTGTPTDDGERIREYVDTVIEGMKTGDFLYLAHPDVMNYRGLDSVYEWEMTRLCRAMKEMAVPLELNMLGASEGRHYPAERFWKIAGEAGCRAIIGVDAHSVDQIENPHGYATCMEMTNKYNLELMNRMDLQQ